MKILSVDDSIVIRRIIRATIETLGFEFLEAADGQQALMVLEDHGHDVGLILLDWNMPNKNGYDTLVAVKQSSKWQHIPVMMVTTEGEKNNVVQAIQAGAKHYMMKPFSQEDLMNRIVECLGLALC